MIKLLLSWVGTQDFHALVKDSPVGSLICNGPHGIQGENVYNSAGLRVGFGLKQAIQERHRAQRLAERLRMGASVLRLLL